MFPTAIRRSLILWGLALVLLVAAPLFADENEPIGQLPTLEEATQKEVTISREVRAILEEPDSADTRGRSGLAGGARIEEAGANPETNDEQIRRVVRQYLLELEQKKAALAKPATDDEWKEVGSNPKMEATWKNGLEFESVNKDFRVHVGGRTQFGLAWFDVDQNVQNDPTLGNRFRDGADFRRARLRVDGTMYEQIEWAVEYDFMNSNLPPAGTTIAVTAPTDLWFTYTKLPYVGNVRVGNQKEPIGFEHQVSSRFLSFIERSFNQDAFYGAFNNGFTPGVSAFDTFGEGEGEGSWAFGLFKPTTNVFASSLNDAWAATGRLTYLPWYVDQGNGLLHLGVGARTSGTENGLRRYRTRYAERSGLSANWPLVGDTGNINADTDQMLNLELAMVSGPFNIQAEYMFNWVQEAYRTNPALAQTLLYNGGYVEVMYFLTGEHRVYEKKRAAFDRVTPIENYFSAPGEGGGFGKGAWQVGVRYNYLNLNDKGIDGGMLHDLTSGINWFLNPNMKIQANYSISHRQSPLPGRDGMIQGFGVQVAHDF